MFAIFQDGAHRFCLDVEINPGFDQILEFLCLRLDNPNFDFNHLHHCTTLIHLEVVVLYSVTERNWPYLTWECSCLIIHGTIQSALSSFWRLLHVVLCNQLESVEFEYPETVKILKTPHLVEAKVVRFKNIEVLRCDPVHSLDVSLLLSALNHLKELNFEFSFGHQRSGYNLFGSHSKANTGKSPRTENLSGGCPAELCRAAGDLWHCEEAVRLSLSKL